MINRRVKHWPCQRNTSQLCRFIIATYGCLTMLSLPSLTLDCRPKFPVPKVTNCRPAQWWGNNFQIALLLPPKWTWNNLFWLVNSLIFQIPLLLPRILSSSHLEPWLDETEIFETHYCSRLKLAAESTITEALLRIQHNLHNVWLTLAWQHNDFNIELNKSSINDQYLDKVERLSWGREDTGKGDEVGGNFSQLQTD